MEPDRRDISGTLADIRVDVGIIKERSAYQGKQLDELKVKLESSVSRGEYETRHNEVVEAATKAIQVAEAVRDEQLRRQGGERVWRIVFTTALAILGVVAGTHR
jgi:hypothetical protein